MGVLDLFKLSKKVAVITGGAGYLGRYFGQALYEAGAKVVFTDLDEDKCRQRAHELSGTGADAMGICMDVTDKMSIEKMMKSVQEKFGKVDILVNAAYQHISSPFEERALADFERILRISLTGTFLCSQTVSALMIKQKSGNIINIASIYGMVSDDPRIYGDTGLNNPEVYSVSKGGIIQFTRYLAVHLAKNGIRVNSLSPGGVLNKQGDEFVMRYSAKVPMNRMANPEELKGALVYLASDASSYVTGHNLIVDGGWTVW